MTLLSLEYFLCFELKTMLDKSFSAKCVCLNKMINATCSVFSHDQITNERVNKMLTKRTLYQLQIFDCISDRMIKSLNNAESYRLSVTS